jgi:hypothetical protein
MTNCSRFIHSRPALGILLVITSLACSISLAAQTNTSGLSAAEANPITANPNYDVLWADSTAHRWLMNNNITGTALVTSWPCNSQGCIPISNAVNGAGFYPELQLSFPVSTIGPGLPLISGISFPQWGGGSGLSANPVYAVDLQTGTSALALATEVPNDTGTGTALNQLATITSTGAFLATTSAPATPSYIVVVDTPTGKTGNAQLAVDGQALCTMDGMGPTTNTQGLYVVASISTRGDCRPISAASTPPFGAWIVGTMISNSVSAGNTALVLVHPGYRSLGGITALSYSSGTTLATASGPVALDLASWDANNNVTDSTIVATSVVTTSTASLTAFYPIIGNGSKTLALGSTTNGTPGAGTKFATATTAPSTQNLTSWDGSGNVKDSGVPTSSAALLVTSSCTGTIGSTASTEYILAPFISSTGTGTACTQAGVTEMPIPVACTAKNLYATASLGAGTGGHSSGGNVELYYNNGFSSTTNLNCQLGNSTSCNDTSHSLAMAAGGTYSIRVKTSATATDTTANIRVSFVCQ